jgi:hypothetical protein
MAEQTPSVGRIVHYVSYGTPAREDGTQAYPSACRAALVTEAGAEGVVGLMVANPTGQFFNRGVVHDGGHAHTEDLAMCDQLFHEGGTWHWPART